MKKKRHFKEKNGECAACLKYSTLIFVEKKYIKCNMWRVAVRPSYIRIGRTLTLSWPAGHICPTYKESFQVRWDNCIPLFLHAAIYLEVYLFRWMLLCAMLLCSIAHSIICTRLFSGKMHSDWFNGIEILQGRWQHGEKVGYSYPSGLWKTLCKAAATLNPEPTQHSNLDRL
jgi:hypothetical protein